MTEKLSSRLWNYVGAGIPREFAERAATLEAELASLREMVEKQTDYSIQLQQLIEAFVDGHDLPFPDLHHHKKLAGTRKLVEKQRAALRHIYGITQNGTDVDLSLRIGNTALATLEQSAEEDIDAP